MKISIIFSHFTEYLGQVLSINDSKLFLYRYALWPEVNMHELLVQYYLFDFLKFHLVFIISSMFLLMIFQSFKSVIFNSSNIYNF